jgi:uncharacterized protein
LLLGAAMGAALLSFAAFALTASGWAQFSWHGTAWGAFLGGAAVQLLDNAWEEAVFRGLLFRGVEGALGSYGAVAVSAAVFGTWHASNPAASRCPGRPDADDRGTDVLRGRAPH